MLGRERRRWAAIVVLLTLVTSCGGAASPDEPKGDESPPVLGELNRLDPCSLVDHDVFAGFDAPPRWKPTFDECRVELTDGQGDLVVYIGPLYPPDAVIGRSAPEGTASYGCSTSVSLAGDVSLSVDVFRAEEHAAESLEADGTLCDASDAVIGSIEKKLDRSRESGVEFRHPKPRAGSLRGVEACDLLRPSEVDRAVGARHVTAFPAGHRCWWNATDLAELGSGESAGRSSDGPSLYPWVRLVLTAGPESAYGDGRSERIAGRDSAVLLEERSALGKCTVATDHGPFPEGADGAREYAVVTVELGDGAEACGVARRLAELAWPRLPAR